MPLRTAFTRLLRGNLQDGASRSWVGRGVSATVIAAAVAAIALPGPSAAQNPQPVPQVQAPPLQATIGQTFGAWQQRCTPGQPPGTAAQPGTESQEACFIAQDFIDPGSRRPVLKVTIGYFGPNRQTGAIIAFPLGVPLARGVQISVDGRPLSPIPFQVCRTNGCQAFLLFNDELIAAFKAGNQAVVRLQSAQNEVLDLPLSLNGFTAGFASIK